MAAARAVFSADPPRLSESLLVVPGFWPAIVLLGASVSARQPPVSRDGPLLSPRCPLSPIAAPLPLLVSPLAVLLDSACCWASPLFPEVVVAVRAGTVLLLVAAVAGGELHASALQLLATVGSASLVVPP